jgi:molybdopterin synthase sulfur carrier subunit
LQWQAEASILHADEGAPGRDERALLPTPTPAMPTVVFTPALQRHVACPEARAPGATVREVLDRVFAERPKARGYILDDAGALRHHVVVFVDGTAVSDRRTLSDAVTDSSEVYVMQALSGG